MIDDVIASHLLARHGERERLVKNVIHFGEETDPPLTEGGAEEARSLGRALLGKSSSSSSAYLIRSTDTARTLQTASLVASELRKELPPPVHSRGLVNDISLRPFDKCPEFSRRVEEWSTSSDFLNFQEAVRGTLQDNSILFTGPCREEANATLASATELYNLYDCIATVAAAAAAAGDGGDSPASLVGSDDVWEDIKTYTEWLEVNKHHERVAGRLLGGAFLGDVSRDFMAAALSANDVATVMHEVTVSVSHYPAMMGVLAALKRSDALPKVPSTTSFLLFELFRGERVVISYSEFHDEIDDESIISSPVTIPILEVSLNEFISLEGVYTKTSEWCSECNNSTADECMILELGRGTGESRLSTVASCGISALVGLCVGVLLILGARTAQRCRRERTVWRAKHWAMEDQEEDQKEETSAVSPSCGTHLPPHRR